MRRRVKGEGFVTGFVAGGSALPLPCRYPPPLPIFRFMNARQPRWQAIQEHWLQHCYRSFAAGRGTPMAAPAADTMG